MDNSDDGHRLIALRLKRVGDGMAVSKQILNDTKVEYAIHHIKEHRQSDLEHSQSDLEIKINTHILEEPREKLS
jgi:hypothetical protein